MIRKTFSNDVGIKKGWILDLGEYGDFEHNGEVLLDEDFLTATIPGAYILFGWVFCPAEITIDLDEKTFNQCLQDPDTILEIGWGDNWVVEPSDSCEVVEEGDEDKIEEILETGFGEYLRKYLRKKGRA